MPRSSWWRALERPSLAAVVGAAAVWVVLVTGLHVVVNHRAALVRAAAARPLTVGGLPVT